MTETYKEKIIKAFDQAQDYDQFAVIQKIVAKRLADKIANLYESHTVSKPMTILEIGCGTGLLTHYLLRLFPEANFVLTDISSEMLLRCQKKFKNNGKITFQSMDGENPQLEGEYDLICSSLAVQWFIDLPLGIKNLITYLKPNGYFICSTLAQKTFVEWRSTYQYYDYPCSLQCYPNLNELQAYWPESGWGAWESEEIIEHSLDGLSFIKALRLIGASVSSQSFSLTASQLKRIISYFNEHYGYCTYHLAYGVFQRFSAKGFFVTGTDTDVGKTFVSACLTKLLKAIYWKPIQTGLNCDQGDSKTVEQLLSDSVFKILSPKIELQEPLSPEAAAKLENFIIKSDFLKDCKLQSDDTYIIEGAGGVFVPINKNQFMIDIMRQINLPVIIVARTKLGTLNHTLMTIDVLRKRNIPIAGVILNGESNEANKKAIIQHGKVKILGEIPQFASLSPLVIEECFHYISIPDEYMLF